MMRTYSRTTWERAQTSWTGSLWGEHWRAWRRLAARAGVIFAPRGSQLDSISDAKPSQRAVLEYAMTTFPELLRQAILEADPSPGWGRVIGRLLSLLPVRESARPSRAGSEPIRIVDVLSSLAGLVARGGTSS